MYNVWTKQWLCSLMIPWADQNRNAVLLPADSTEIQIPETAFRDLFIILLYICPSFEEIRERSRIFRTVRMMSAAMLPVQK